MVLHTARGVHYGVVHGHARGDGEEMLMHVGGCGMCADCRGLLDPLNLYNVTYILL